MVTISFAGYLSYYIYRGPKTEKDQIVRSRNEAPETREEYLV